MITALRRQFLPILAVAAILLLGGLAALMLQQRQETRLTANAEAVLAGLTAEIGDNFDTLFIPATAIADAVIEARLQDLAFADVERLFFALAGHPVRRLPQINGLYLGFPDGSFLHSQEYVPTAVMERAGDRLDPAMGVRRLLRPGGQSGRPGPQNRWFYAARDGSGWIALDLPADGYDPRQRPWYREALASQAAIWTAPYVFASTGKLGVTHARALRRRDGRLWAVLGIDMTIESLSDILRERQMALDQAGSIVFATDPAGAMVGHPQLRTALEKTGPGKTGGNVAEALQSLSRPGSLERALIDAAPAAGLVQRVGFGGTEYIMTRTELRGEAAMPMHVYLAQDLGLVTAAARRDLERNLLLLLLGTAIAAAVIAYAVKLRVEMTARQRAERELVAARDQAEAATRAKSNFLATMSHEIRTPMNGVMSMAEMLELTPLNGEQHRMARVIRDSAQALLTVINDILDFSKIEAGRLDIEHVAFSLAETVDGVGELLASRADEKMLELAVDIDPSLADRRIGDPTRLRQVLLNLGGNAVKFTHEGAVTLKAMPLVEGDGDDWLRFEVRDSGIGLTPEQMQRLFQPFEQADSSTARKYGGTGLGLSICRRLCEMMGGRIGVDSIFGQGSVFWFELPLPLADPAETAEQSSDALSALLVGLPAEHQAVAIRHLRAAGAEVAAAGMAAAQDLMATRDFDLVLVDARCGDGALQAPERLGAQAQNRGGKTTFGLLAPRALVSTLDAAAHSRFHIALTYPLSGASLRRAAGIATGRIDPGSMAATFREDMAFAPPDIETARTASALILVAEDNPTNRLVIEQMLARMGYACEIGDHGAAALALYARGGHGLLLTDFHMPEMDGFELTARIRALEADGRPRLPIVALTADALTGTEQQCLEAGMDGYLSKPVNSRALAAMLETWMPQALPLRRPAGAADNTLQPTTTAPGPSWDRDIFDPSQLRESFGGFNDLARQLLRDFVADAGLRVAAIAEAVQGGDPQVVRPLAHALKGGAYSVGAKRLGTIASDLQDACDEADTAMMNLMAEMLAPTLDELRDLLPTILQNEDIAA
ncbi:MAG: ATP-binding protein [Ferrovibrio sp.]|uniref:hybrid sensor histidine kinase/response regulator n=1 Tax=Ferrovibrio sp. TaxID=1917215 RepID=UPI00391BDB4A